VARSRASDARQYTSWDRDRLSVVVPIGVIVAVAIVCVVVAVLSSAQRADVVAVDNERQMFSRALSNYGERVLREAESVASSDGAIQHIRQSFNYDWVNQRVGAWLEAYFDHDYIFVFDSNDRLIYSLVDHRPADAKWLAVARPELTPVIDFMRGRDQHPRGAIRLNQMNPPDTGKLP
jgi:sensor domain CHASE-containing protein